MQTAGYILMTVTGAVGWVLVYVEIIGFGLRPRQPALSQTLVAGIGLASVPLLGFVVLDVLTGYWTGAFVGWLAVFVILGAGLPLLGFAWVRPARIRKGWMHASGVSARSDPERDDSRA